MALLQRRIGWHGGCTLQSQYLYCVRSYIKRYIHAVINVDSDSTGHVGVMDDDKQPWQIAIGLEVHAQIKTLRKLFSNSSRTYASASNSCLSLFDVALPGTLPVLNDACVTAALRTALALNCHINELSMFDRKHYFYPDLALGYQITQQHKPVAYAGHVILAMLNDNEQKRDMKKKNKKNKKNKLSVSDDVVNDQEESKTSTFDTATSVIERHVRILQLQLEQDTAKMTHTDCGSVIDFNRAGSALMEIVTAPDMGSADEAMAFIRELQLLLRLVDSCDCHMARGSLRVDANISVKKGDLSSVRTEVKNVRSVRALGLAIDSEVARHIDILKSGGAVTMETRRYDEQLKSTVFMRSKEAEKDYRFMPEPDLPPLVITKDRIDKERLSLPELPHVARHRLMTTYQLPVDYCIKLVADQGVEVFEAAMTAPMRDDVVGRRDAKALCTLINGMLFNALNMAAADNIGNITPYTPLVSCPVSGAIVAEVSDSIAAGILLKSRAVDVFSLIIRGDERPVQSIVTEEGWALIVDSDLIASSCRDIIAGEGAKFAHKYRDGELKYFNPLLGCVLATNEFFDTNVVKKVLSECLSNNSH